MSYCASFFLLFLFSFLTSFRASAQDPFYLSHNCPNTTTYSSNSTYSTNLKTLLSSLSSRNASYSTGFQNATAGQDTHRVTGIFLCRGDLSPEVCSNCIAFSVHESLIRCPNEREAVFYYEECMLRYSNRNILSTLNTDGGIVIQNTMNFTAVKKDRFRDLVLTPMNLAAIEAARSFKKFAVRKVGLNALQSLYGMVQCTPDLTEQDCLDCLQQSINQVTNDKIGGRILVPSCNSRYDLYAFYNDSNVGTPQPQLDSAPPLPPPPISTSLPRPGKGRNSSVIVIAVVVPITAVLLLFVAVFCVRAKNKRTLYEMEPLAREDADDRPNMSVIVQMITTSSIVLPVPKQPGFFFRGRNEQVGELGPSMDRLALCSIDDASITSVAPR
ncbi:unnamed protein product [Arabidopsis arenosa]|uniref:Gnk2-homologous domain-containing protein n=1 Tax=Arabidopsis arenosa TaxID=38785 RepID=A0A8S2AVJ2_ARAAE|nr:unnamed protein product [Arabidopsis arenosa]